MNDPTPVMQARASFEQARATRLQAEATLVARTAQLTQLSRSLASNDKRLREAQLTQQVAARGVEIARQNEKGLSSALTDALGAWLPGDPVGDVGQLDGGYPIALLPVRLETRFDASTPELQIRIYPDEIFADSHEPQLTDREAQDGAAYWSDAATVGEKQAWQTLLGKKYQAPRAAWIVLATSPNSQSPGVRSSTWTRAVEARLLPDRWVALAYRGGVEVGRAFSTPVLEPLALTIGPETPTPDTVDVSGHGLKLDDRVVWTIDFNRALSSGMAIRMPIQPADLKSGFERLVVCGVKASLTAGDAATRLSALLDAHHYSAGLAFVPQGAPTSNTAGTPAAYPPPDPANEISFAVERGQPLDVTDGDGAHWCQALGLGSSVVSHVAGADGSEQDGARAMNRALLPATLGYFLRQIMSPLLSDATVDEVGQYFVEFVRGRGPLPAFRVGRVPYGLLPVSSLARWQPGAESGVVDSQLPLLLQRLLPRWQQQMASVPRVGRTSDGDRDLLEVLAMDASCRELRVRKVVGESALWNLTQLLGVEWDAWQAIYKSVAAQVLLEIGAPSDSDPRVVNLNFANTAPRFNGPFVANPLSESAPLINNYIQWLRTASLDDVRNEKLPFAVPGALLYKLLRHAELTELTHAAMVILTTSALADASDQHEVELVKIAPGTEQRRTIWEQVARSVPSVTGTRTLAEYLSASEPSLPQAVLDYRDALALLEKLPTAELDRLCTETLDLCSHRLDAWITSLATKRLAELRLRQETGVHIGALGWVESLLPSSDPLVPLGLGSDRKPRMGRAQSGGYIHSPSMMHAATAAILRNAFLTHQLLDGPQPYALDLSSASVRMGRFILDSVREGQPVGAVLGYQFERGLHERQIELFIDPLRQKFPLVANKTEDSGEQADLVAARNVVDGLQLRNTWLAGTLGINLLPGTEAQKQALQAELNRLNTAVDTVADLLLAESVHQVVRGSTSASSAGLDAMAAGARPPEPDVGRAPTGGTALTHRIAVIVGGDPLAAGPGWAAQPTPRAAAEPRLDGWVGSLLGDPRQVRCRVSWPDPTDSTIQHEQEVTFDQLGLRPLDVLAMARSVADAQLAAELDRRVIFAALGDAPTVAPITVVYTAATGWDRAVIRTVPELLDVAQAIGQVIGGARALRPEDLVRPDSPIAGTVKTEGILADEALGRATAAETQLSQARQALDAALTAVADPPTDSQLAAVRGALRTAAQFGLAAAYPISGKGIEEGSVPDPLLKQAASTRDEIDSRLVEAAKKHPAGGAGPLDQLDAAAAIAAEVFGREFMLLGGFQPTSDYSDELNQALLYGPTLVGDNTAPRRWLQQAARVRAPLARWRKMRLLAEATGVSPAAFDIAQLPHDDSARWVALPLASDDDRKSGRVSLALHRPVAPPTDGNWYGLFVDEWPEIIPNTSEHTGIAFHYEDSGGEAPQAVFLAVPPVLAASWDFDTLIAIVNETIDLAKIRAVDGELLGDLGQLLPAMVLSVNIGGDTISTRFIGQLVDETKLQQGGS